MQKDSLPLAQLIQSYDLFNQASGKSPTTVAWYNDRLGTFLRFLGQDGRLSDLTVDAAHAYIVYLQNRNDRFAGNPDIIHKEGKLSSAYINGCVRSLRAFANWLFAEGHTDSHRLQLVKPPKVQKKVMQVLSDEEVQKLLGASTGTTSSASATTRWFTRCSTRAFAPPNLPTSGSRTCTSRCWERETRNVSCHSEPALRRRWRSGAMKPGHSLAREATGYSSTQAAIRSLSSRAKRSFSGPHGAPASREQRATCSGTRLRRTISSAKSETHFGSSRSLATRRSIWSPLRRPGERPAKPHRSPRIAHGPHPDKVGRGPIAPGYNRGDRRGRDSSIKESEGGPVQPRERYLRV